MLYLTNEFHVMKVLLVGPSNYSLMPYLVKYRRILEGFHTEVDVLEWDRLGLGSNSKFTYTDKKKGFSRSVLDYIKFSKYVKTVIKSGEYQKYVVFSLQSAFFLKGVLTQTLRNQFIFDIRDWNSILKISDFNSVIKHSRYTVISSPAFSNFLPKGESYIVSHNVPAGIDINNGFELNLEFDPKIVRVSSIGSFRNFRENVDLLKELGYDDLFKIEFRGEGPESEKLKSFVEKNKFPNVFISGKYEQSEERGFYENTNLVNIVEYPNKTSQFLLPNRLYHAVIFFRPVIVIRGSYLSEIVQYYNLGVTLPQKTSFRKSILDYLEGFDRQAYLNGRESFLEMVKKDEESFLNMLKQFISN